MICPASQPATIGELTHGLMPSSSISVDPLAPVTEPHPELQKASDRHEAESATNEESYCPTEISPTPQQTVPQLAIAEPITVMGPLELSIAVATDDGELVEESQSGLPMARLVVSTLMSRALTEIESNAEASGDDTFGIQHTPNTSAMCDLAMADLGTQQEQLESATAFASSRDTASEGPTTVDEYFRLLAE